MSNFSGFSEFSVGSVIRNAWKLVWRKPFAFFGITLVSLILSTVMAVALTDVLTTLLSWFIVSVDTSFLSDKIWFSALTFSMAIVHAFFEGTLTYAIFMLLLHGRASIADAFRRSAGRVPSIILASIIVAFVLLLLSFLEIFGDVYPEVLFDFITSSGVFGVLGIIMFPITFLIFLIARGFSIILKVRWFVFAQVCTVERIGAMASLRRSSYLTKDYFAKIFGIYFFCLILVPIFFVIARFFINLIFGSGLLVVFEPELLGNIFSAIVATPPFIFVNAMSAVVYFNLRVVKENFTLESLADIFD